jgi:tRNA pseudouridine55 synthase
MDRALSGVLVVDKPAGPTSHDIVDRVRAVLGVRRVGHLGTLDPFATGVLPVCVGKATRLVRFLAEGEKIYRARIRLGFSTTTDDLTGEPRTEARAVSLDPALVAAACQSLTGILDQLPPAYSAKRQGGRRLYELARERVAVAAAPSRVTVHRIDILEAASDHLEVEVSCSPGTYIRALARDLGDRLGCGGHLAALRRLRSSGFGLEGALPGDALDEGASKRLIPLRDCLSGLPAVCVGPEGRRAVGHGRDLTREMTLRGFPEEGPPSRLRILDEEGELVGVAVPRGFDFRVKELPVVPALHPEVVLVD